jgi:digeranylgeranylglycerophospholipid reductase
MKLAEKMRNISPKDYDVIIAGGGFAGTIVAQSVAYYSNQSLKILVIDRNLSQMPGMKNISGWICGDAISKEAVDLLADKIKVKWDKPELEHKLTGLNVISPDRETVIPFPGDGYMLNRKILPEKQTQRTVALGVDFDFEINLMSLIYDENQVIGVRGIDNKTNQSYQKTAKVVVDATGMISMLRNQISNTTKIEKRIDRHDIGSTGRHILYFEKGEEDLSEFDTDSCIIHMDQDIAPGAYGWVFPKGENKVNIGLGVEKSLLDKRNKRLGRNDNLSMLINQYVKRNKVIKNPRLSDDPEDNNNAIGNFQVSVRRQNDCLVANGFALIGDSAWMAKPIDAGGFSPIIHAGTILGKCIVEAIESGDVTEKVLWNYNKQFIDEYGYKTAGLELVRRLVQHMTNDQISYGMKYFMGNLDIDPIIKGEHPDFGVLDKLGLVIRGALNRKLADGLIFTSKQNKQLIEHYHNFPESPAGFDKWSKNLHMILDESNEKLQLFYD